MDVWEKRRLVSRANFQFLFCPGLSFVCLFVWKSLSFLECLKATVKCLWEMYTHECSVIDSGQLQQFLGGDFL